MKKKTKTPSGFNALVWKEDDLFVARALEVDIASQGTTAKEALNNLEEAIELYFEDEKVSLKLIKPFKHLKLLKISPNLRYA